MNETNTWLSKFHEGRDSVNNSTTLLAYIAEGFRRTGNAHMYNELMNIADEIDSGAKAMGDAIHQHLNEGVQQSYNNITSAFQAVLERVAEDR